MRLIQVAEDKTMLVSGYEHHTWQCSACSTIERRMTFTREKTLIEAPVQPSQTVPVQIVPLEPTQTAPLEQPLETTEAVPLEPIQTGRVQTIVPLGPARTMPSPPESPPTVLQTNARAEALNEKLRKLQVRATVLKEAVGEVERRAQFKRVWEDLRPAPSPSVAIEPLSRVHPDKPVRSPVEPLTFPAAARSIKDRREIDSPSIPMQIAPGMKRASTVQDEQVGPPSLLGRVVALLRGQ